MNRREASKVFISYARENLGEAMRLYADLQRAGIDPWIDREDLLPGQKWKFAITRAIRESKFFIALMSQASLTKQGYVQKELREALELLDEIPEDQIFVIPVRLDDCHPSHPQLKELHRVDLFPVWEAGMQRVLVTLGVGRGFEFRPAVTAPSKAMSVLGETYETVGALALDLKTEAEGTMGVVKYRLALMSRLSVVDRIMVENLQLESHLPVSAMRRLLIAMVESSEEPSEIRAAIRGVCRANPLRGGKIRVSKQTIFTSVRSLDTFCLWLVESNVFPSVISARDWASRLSPKGSSSLIGLPGDLLLSPYINWAYLVLEQEDSPQGLDAEQIRRRLGIRHFPRGDSLVLFEYILPRHITPQFPTFCDAYASEPWPTNFRPAPSDAPYGITVPSNDSAAPLPEVVHAPVQLKHVFSARLVR